MRTYATSFCILILFLNALIVGSVLRIRVYPAPEADFQTYLKISVWLVSLFFCVFFLKSSLPKMLRADNFFMTLFLMICIISVAYAPLVYFSTGAIFTVVAVFVFAFTASTILDNASFFRTCFYAFSLICAISIVAYFVIPEFARYREWKDGVLIVGNRLCGITGTANHMGFIAAFALLLAVRMIQEKYTSMNPLFLGLVAIDFIALIMSNSRTSLAALVISVIAASFLHPSYQKLSVLCLGGAVVIALFLFGDTEQVFSAVSRSGEASEITTGTGRSDIWRVVTRLIQERPILGYGYASSLQILDATAEEVGFKAASAHNLVLQIILSTGYFSFLVFLLAYLFKGYTAVMNRDMFIVSGLLFILIIGMSESVAFQGTANTSTLALALIFSARYSRESQTPENLNPTHRKADAAFALPQSAWVNPLYPHGADP